MFNECYFFMKMLQLRAIQRRWFLNTSSTCTCRFHTNYSDRLGGLCKILNDYSKVSNRNQSMSTNPECNTSRIRKKRKKAKKFAELLEVSEKSSAEKKAPIQRLNSTDLKRLAISDISLSELYKLRIPPKHNLCAEEHIYNNLTSTSFISGGEFDTFSNAIQSENSDSRIRNSNVTGNFDKSVIKTVSGMLGSTFEKLDLLDERQLAFSAVNTIEAQSGLLNEFAEEEQECQAEEEEEIEVTTKSKRVRPRKKNPPLDQNTRTFLIEKTLRSYLEVCCSQKCPQRGLSAFYYYRGACKRFKNPIRIKDVSLYNLLLKAFAVKPDMDKISELLNIMREEHVPLNVQSYVAIFECLGRSDKYGSHAQQIKKYAKLLTAQKLTLNDLFDQGNFTNDDREIVLKALKRVDANFVPTYSPPQLQYENKLTNNLNNKEQLEPKVVTYRSNRGMFTPDSMQKLIMRQLESEKNFYETISSIEAQEKPTPDVLKHRNTLNELYKTWEQNATKAFERDLQTLSVKRSAINMDVYMRSIPVKDFVSIIVDEAIKIAQGSETYSPTVFVLYRNLGQKVFARYKVLRKQKTGVLDKLLDIHTKYCTNYAALHGELDVLPEKGFVLNGRQQWQWIEYEKKANGASLLHNERDWVNSVFTEIGKFLYHIIMYDLKVDVNSTRAGSSPKNYMPAFYTIFRNQFRSVKEEVKPHPVLMKLYRGSKPETLTFPTFEMPMVCPPVPWMSYDLGGYLISHSDLVRLPPFAVSQKQYMCEMKQTHLYPTLDSLNQLGSVAWKVNTKILDLVIQIFNSGGSKKLDIPEPPSSLEPPPISTSDMDKSQRYALFRQKLQHRRKKGEMYSLWCDCLYRLSLANHFRNDVFWFPHNMDFRGRVYPISPHFNHLGSDLARSMLVFAEGRPLGEHGLDWLKIHLINLTGLKKKDPQAERLKYANSNIDLILDSADNPLEGQRWWTTGDEPWQALACCMEIAAAMRSPDPRRFFSHFPVHQDGSCNGLQHYAALGKDQAGAYSVNLCSSDIPQDIYSAVVNLVEKQRQIDAAQGVKPAQVLEGFVRRKVIKQTIMTTVYGVTRFGARLQIAKQLKDLDDFPKEEVWATSAYLTGRTMDSLRTMFTSTKMIQDWLTDCARVISSVHSKPVEWVTPLGLPVVQPYVKFKALTCPRSLYDTFANDRFGKPSIMKQKNAFPPNFIHSLDSSHMMLTSLNAERAGITFVSVHDCFWTHASTVHIMNKICREQFVRLHSEPILEDLSQFFKEKYGCLETNTKNSEEDPNDILVQVPDRGDYDINEVLQSVYFFS